MPEALDTAPLSEALADVLHGKDLADKLAFHAERKHGELSQEARAGAAIAEALGRATKTLERAGVVPAGRKTAAGLDLSDLSALENTRPVALELAESLAALLPLAEKLDRLRGRSVSSKVPLTEYEVAGCDVAEIINDLRLRLLSEGEPVAGKGWE